jgi:hypothetical protein
MSLSFLRASGKEVANLIENIKEVIEGEPVVNVHVACLVLALIAQKPDMTPEELQSVVKECSAWIVTRLYDSSVTGAVN